MIYKKLTKKERIEFRRHKQYAAAIGRVMAKDPSMTLAEARKILRDRQKNRTKTSKKSAAAATRQIAGSDYAALREQWELAGGDASVCPFGDDYAGPFLDWDGDEWLIRLPMPAKELL